MSVFNSSILPTSAPFTLTWPLPAASGYTNQVVFASNLGVGGSLWRSDGTKWYAVSPITQFTNAIPIGIAPTGTMANNGAVTLGTALNNIYSGGIWLYFPANAIVTGSAAGFYWTVMSSTTVGTVFNNTYTVANGNFPSKPSSPVSFVTTGPGAFTGVTTEINIISFLIPGGSLGINGRMVNGIWVAVNNTAGTKTLRWRLGGTLIGSATHGAVLLNYIPKFQFLNRGDQAINVSTNGVSAGTSTTAATVMTTLNTATDLTFTQTLQLATATDTIIVELSEFELWPNL